MPWRCLSWSRPRVYYPYMASIVGKKRGNATYYYLVESARVDGKPRIVSQEYLGTAGELAAAMRGGGLGLPDRTGHKEFGAVAAAWGVLEDLGVAAIIDEVAGPGPSGLPLSAGTYLVLAALNRLVAPCSKLAFADWWKTTAAGRFTKIPATALDHRRFWDAMHAVTLGQLAEISRQIAVRIVQAARRGLLVGGAGHDELRDLHRYRQRQGAGGAAGQGQAEARRPAAGGPGPGGHPGRRDPADLARLPRRPARRHPVPRHDRSAARPVPGGHRSGRRPAR